jgi:hypothetical protein
MSNCEGPSPTSGPANGSYSCYPDGEKTLVNLEKEKPSLPDKVRVPKQQALCLSSSEVMAIGSLASLLVNAMRGASLKLLSSF